MAEHTLAMADRTGEHSEWIDRTRDALKTIDQSIADEAAALAKLPYTKQDFEAYFAQMSPPVPPAPAAHPAKGSGRPARAQPSPARAPREGDTGPGGMVWVK